MANMKSVNRRDGSTLAEDVETARGLRGRLIGLIGRADMPPGSAYLITGCRQIHTFLMRFPIDVIFIDSSGVVVGLEENISPYRISGCYAAAADTLELPSGTISSSSVVIGDHLRFDD